MHNYQQKPQPRKPNKNVFQQSRSNLSNLSQISNYSNVSVDRHSANWRSTSRVRKAAAKKANPKTRKNVKPRTKKNGVRTKDSQITSLFILFCLLYFNNVKSLKIIIPND